MEKGVQGLGTNLKKRGKSRSMMQKPFTESVDCKQVKNMFESTRLNKYGLIIFI